ncbi:TPA: hypothetical protein IGZ65_004285 [Escherichia coli]|nr:hypothetical protein [Escherichia coli]
MQTRVFNHGADIEGKIRSFTSGMTPVLTEEWYPEAGTERQDGLKNKLISTMKIFLARMEYGAALPGEIEESDEIISSSVLALFGMEQENLRHFYSVLKSQRNNISQVSNHYHTYDLNEVFTDAINMSKTLFDMLEKMRWLIEEHNIDCGPRDKGNRLTSPEEIRAFLKSWKTVEDNGV